MGRYVSPADLSSSGPGDSEQLFQHRATPERTKRVRSHLQVRMSAWIPQLARCAEMKMLI
jgi:hypothetical protein